MTDSSSSSSTWHKVCVKLRFFSIIRRLLVNKASANKVYGPSSDQSVDGWTTETIFDQEAKSTENVDDDDHDGGIFQRSVKRLHFGNREEKAAAAKEIKRLAGYDHLRRRKTAEDAARAYDEAARLMCGPRARTNFPYNPNLSQSSSSKLLSATLTAKLHRCYMASLQISKPSIQQQQKMMNQKQMWSTHVGESSPEKKPTVVVKHQQPAVENNSVHHHHHHYHQQQQFFATLEGTNDRGVASLRLLQSIKLCLSRDIQQPIFSLSTSSSPVVDSMYRWPPRHQICRRGHGYR